MDTKKLYKTDFDNIVWQEVFDNGVRLDRNITIIEVWKNFGNGWKDELRKVILSTVYIVIQIVETNNIIVNL